jgi:hypothetical protein
MLLNINFNPNLNFSSFINKIINKIPFFKKENKKFKFKYSKFYKKIAIYEDGHAIVINYLEIKTNEKIEKIERFIDIADGCKDIKLPTFNEMKNLPIEERFEKPGFWCKSNYNIKIKLIEDIATRKKFHIVFQPPLEKGNSIKISYAFSIPCAYPLSEGKLDPQKLSQNPYTPKLSFMVKHPIEIFEYEIAFFNCPPKNLPQVRIYKGDEAEYKTESIEEILDPFYYRYKLRLEKPDVYSRIEIAWEWE